MKTLKLSKIAVGLMLATCLSAHAASNSTLIQALQGPAAGRRAAMHELLRQAPPATSRYQLSEEDLRILAEIANHSGDNEVRREALQYLRRLGPLPDSVLVALIPRVSWGEQASNAQAFRSSYQLDSPAVIDEI